MLWNPKHDQKKVAGEEDYSGEISARGLISWLRKQKRETKFNFYSTSGGCLIGKYLKATGQFSGAAQERIYCEDICGIHVGKIIASSVNEKSRGTFGESLVALSRAEKILESHS